MADGLSDRPDGDRLLWKFAPIEPTQEMVRAAYREQPDTINAGFAQAYRAMISAAPVRDAAEGADWHADFRSRCRAIGSTPPKPAPDAVRAALAEKVRKDIACTRTYTMKEWAIIEDAISAPVPAADGAFKKYKCSHCGEMSDVSHDAACGVW